MKLQKTTPPSIDELALLWNSYENIFNSNDFYASVLFHPYITSIENTYYSQSLLFLFAFYHNLISTLILKSFRYLGINTSEISTFIFDDLKNTSKANIKIPTTCIYGKDRFDSDDSILDIENATLSFIYKSIHCINEITPGSIDIKNITIDKLIENKNLYRLFKTNQSFCNYINNIKMHVSDTSLCYISLNKYYSYLEFVNSNDYKLFKKKNYNTVNKIEKIVKKAEAHLINPTIYYHNSVNNKLFIDKANQTVYTSCIYMDAEDELAADIFCISPFFLFAVITINIINEYYNLSI